VINLALLLTGKTMIMDMFYGATQGIVQHRRRFHFHEVNEELSMFNLNQSVAVSNF
jgi:predicted ATPase